MVLRLSRFYVEILGVINELVCSVESPANAEDLRSMSGEMRISETTPV